MTQKMKIAATKYCENPELILEINRKALIIAKPFLNQLGLADYCFIRCYRDGSFQPISGAEGIVKDYFLGKMGVQSARSKESMHEKTFMYCWSEGPNKEFVDALEEKYNISEGITFVQSYKNHYDVIGFAFNDQTKESSSYFLNNVWRFEDFISEFKPHAEVFFKQMGKVCVMPPRELFDLNLERMFSENKKNKFSLKTANIEVYLTLQERTCLMLFNSRRSIKEIAREMEISPKSVESYLDRIKNKTGIAAREDLRKLAMYCE